MEERQDIEGEMVVDKGNLEERLLNSASASVSVHLSFVFLPVPSRRKA